MRTSKRKATHITIVGSCVCRDVFEIVKQCDGFCADKENEYIVDKYIQSIAFVSAMSPRVASELGNRMIEESLSSKKQNFFKKMFRLDVEKNWYEYISEARSEWLILDMTPARFKLCKIGDTYLTYDLAVAVAAKCENKSEGTAMGALLQCEMIDPSTIDKAVLRETYHRWIERLLKLYPQNRIIVVKAKNTKTYVDQSIRSVLSPDLYVEKNSEHENELFSYAYECVLEKLPRAHVIDPPALVIGNPKHKWGKLGLHYDDDTYLYMYRCIDYIIHARQSRAKERLYMMEQNRWLCEKLFDKYVSSVHNSVQSGRNILNLQGGLKPGTYCKNGVSLTISPDYEFSVRGSAEEETVFYLLSSTGNPCGGWSSAREMLPRGRYLFTTKVECRLEEYFVQLVLTDEAGEKRWIYGNLSNSFEIDHDYAYRLIRFVVKAGCSVDVSGRLLLEPARRYEV